MHVETNDDWDSPRELTPPAPALTESNVQEKKPKKKKSIFWSMASNSSNAGASDSGLSDDGEGSSRAGAGAASKSQRLKFSKGKKLHKSMSQAYMKQLNAAKGSKFANWTKAELVELLIHHHIGDESDGIHIRNEANIDVVVLRDMADELFEGKDPPPKPRLPGLEEVVLKNVMARRIQDAWVEYQYAKRERVEMHRSMYYRDQVRRIESHHEVDKIGKAELLYMSLGGTVGDIEQGGNDMMLTEDQDAANLVLNESFLLQDRTQLDDLERRYEAKSNEPSGPLVSSRDSNDQKKRQNVLDLPWQPPNIERAQRYADYVQPRKGGKGGKLFDYFNTTTGRHCCLGSLGEQFDLWEEGRISEFSIYGPGVTNYFKFIKFALWLFLLLTVLSLPMLALNSVPDNKDDEIGLKQLASTTIGNLAVTQVNGTLSIDVPGCDSFALLGSTCRFDGKDLSLLYSVLDIIISCVVFIGFIWLSLFEQYEEIELNRSTIKASMYTIVVSNLPQDVTEVDLLNHFGSIVGRKDAISCISLAYNNEDEIELCKKRGDIIRKKIILVHEHRRDCTRLNGRTDLSEEDKNVRLVNDRNAFFEKMKKLNQDLSTLEKQLEDLSKEELGVVYAYITFNKSTDRDIAYDAYHKNTLYAYLFNKTKRLLLNNQLLVVNHAPEPSVILWENLQYSYYERWKRRGVTIILSLFFIIITLAMIFSSKYLQEKASNNGYKSASVCPGDFTTWTIAEQQSYVDQNPSYLHCYCDQYSAIDQADDSYCKSYLQDTINSQVLMYFASFIVLVVNALITYIFKIYVMYEKHHTSDGQGISIFFRLFVLKYINTACVFLINNNNVILRSIFNIHISSAPSFTAKWYNSVGVTIILVQLGDIITGNLDGIIKCITYYSRRYRAFNNPESLLTQEQLNKQFVGPEFEFAFNYAQIMATLFVTLTFSTGIPLLYPIAAANFCLSYWIEKFLFINVYKIPPHFNTVVGRRASGLIPIAILIHIAVAIWMLSNKSIFTDEIATNNESLAEYYYSSSSSGQSAGDITFNARRRVTEEATLPLFILFFIILFIWIFMYVTQFVTIGLERFYTFYLGCTTNEENRESNAGALKAFKKAQESVTYVRAVKRNLIKGLATYNILQNPAYKEAFGITWKFAIDHHDVRSIRKHKLRAQHSEFEDNADEIESLQRSALAHSLPHKIHHVHTEQPTSSTGPPPTIASRRTKRPSHSETGSAASEASRLSYKSVTKNRSFYGSFYEQQKSEQIILQIDKQKEFQNLMKQERKGRSNGAGSSTDKKKRREKRSGGGGGSGTTSPPPPPPSAISPTPASAVQERRKGKSSDKSPGTSGRSKSRHPPPVTLKQSHHPMAGRPLPSSSPTSPQPLSSRNNYAPVPVVAEAHAINAEAIDPNHFDIEMRPNPFDPRIHQYHHQQYYPGAAQHPPPPVQYVPMTGGPSAISSPTTSGSYAGALGGAFPQQYPSRGGEHRHLHRPRQGQPKPHQYY